MKFRRLEPIIILSEISGTVSNMTSVATLAADGLTQGEISEVLGIHEYRVGLMMNAGVSLDVCRGMLGKCKDADLELKSGRGGYVTLEKLICSI
jgi:DNA polymerase III delta subunit